MTGPNASIIQSSTVYNSCSSPCLIVTLSLTVPSYKKVLRSKDLSSASSEDLDCVFGRRGRKERKERKRERGERGGGEEEEEGEEEEKKERTKRTKTEGTSENEV